MRNAAKAAEALDRATNGQSLANYPAIFEGFAEKGIPEDQIKPRENVLTFNAWRAAGRTVKRGEHGVKVSTWVPITKANPETGEPEPVGKRPRVATVFHISQTVELAPAICPVCQDSACETKSAECGR